MPATKGAFLIAPPRAGPQATGVISLMYRNRVTNGIIAIIVAYNAVRSYYVDAAGMIAVRTLIECLLRRGNRAVPRRSYELTFRSLL